MAAFEIEHPSGAGEAAARIQVAHHTMGHRIANQLH